MELNDLTNTSENLQRTIDEQSVKIKKYQDKVKGFEFNMSKTSEENEHIQDKIDEYVGVLHEKNRKIKYLEEEIEDLSNSNQRKIVEKETIINEIKLFSQEE